MRLAPKLGVLLLGGVFCVFGLFAFLRIQRELEQFADDIRQDQRAMARSLVPAIEQVWETDGELRAQSVVLRANTNNPDVSVRFVWLDAVPRTRFAPAFGAEELDAIRQRKLAHFFGTRSIEAGRQVDDSVEAVVTITPVATPGLRVGALEISESLTKRSRYVRTTVRNVLLATATMAVICALIVLFVGRSLVTQPVAALTRKARQVGEGNLSEDIELDQADEFCQLADELNAMCRRLATAQANLVHQMNARITAIEQLRHADRLAHLGKLASAIAHEIGTPLNVISGHAMLIAKRKTEGDDVMENAQTIVEQCDRITRIVQQILDYGRRSPPRRHSLDILDIIEATASLLSPLAERSSITLVVDGVPGSRASVDDSKIQQALTNLIVNAIQASAAGTSVTISVTKRTACRPTDGAPLDAVCIRIKDEGSGMSTDVQARMFEPFFTTKEAGAGTGLGLSISHQIIEDHAGWLAVTSELGRGTCFEIYLPRERAT